MAASKWEVVCCTSVAKFAPRLQTFLLQYQGLGECDRVNTCKMCVTNTSYFKNTCGYGLLTRTSMD